MVSISPHEINDYHDFIPHKDNPRIAGLDHADPYLYAKKVTADPRFKPLFEPRQANLRVPFSGITCEGVKREGIFNLQDEGAPTASMVAAARRVIKSFTSEERSKAMLDLDSEEWRKWSNPEIIMYEVGLRLEHLQKSQIDLITELLKQSMSEVGFAKVEASIKMNKFLGEICNSRSILNEHSYFFALFGDPSETEPWGYTFFGHHLCLNIFLVGNQMSISPVFIGAEPNIIDSGPDRGVELCIKEAEISLQLMQSLSPELQKRAQIYPKLHDPAMPEGRWHPADQRHLAGAFHDNRSIPFEGITVTEMDATQRSKLMSIVAAFFELLPPGPFECRMSDVRKHIDETYFSWIGGYGPDDPFYYRIQSPVVLLEFDHHSGVFLTNTEPAKYHTHTIIRTPNGNDYAREWINLYRKKKNSE